MEGKNKGMGLGERTSLARANNKSSSLRTTVPKGIVSNFGLKEGDSLYWTIRPSKNAKRLIIVVEPKSDYRRRK